MTEKNIVLVGVGGQGLITLGRVLGNTATNKGVKALTAETHGMAQRGGSVIVHVRMGNVNAPLIPKGMADAILGLEILETIRDLEYANNETEIIINNRIIRPQIPKIVLPKPEELIKELKKQKIKLEVLNAQELAIKAGNEITENIVMLGALMKTGILDGYINIEDIEETLRRMFPPAIAEMNIKALRLGYDTKR